MEHVSPTPSPIGGRSFIDHARVRILLAPVGDVSEADFAEWCEYVRAFETIRLIDLPSTSGVRKTAASSASPILQTGEVHLSFVTSYDPDHAFLAPFNLHRQVLGVLGLTSYTPLVDRDELERTPAALRELHPGAIVHRIFAFDKGARRPETVDLSSAKGLAAIRGSPSGTSTPPASTDSGFSSRKDGGLVIFPAVRKDGKDVKFYLKTLLSEFVAGVLDGLDQVVSGLEGATLETPRETLGGIAHSANISANRGSSFSNPFGAGSGGSRSYNAIGGGSQPGDLSVTTPSTESTRSKLIAANANKKTKRIVSTLATGPTGTGRFAKVKADFHLLCGNLWEALDSYTTSLNALGKERALAGGQDAVWFASALEGFSVTRVLVSRMGGPLLEKAPHFDLPWSGKDKDRDKDGIPRPYAKESWGEVAEAYTVALIIYSKCLAPPNVLLEAAKSVTNETPRDFTHPLIHAGACVQYARFLLAVWASAGWNGECFDQLVYGGVPPSLAEDRPTQADYFRLTGFSGVARHEIGAAASSALTHSVAALKSSDQITLLSTLTGIFGCIGFTRREAYLLNQLQQVVIKLLERAIKAKSRTPETFSLPLQCAPLTQDEVLGNMVVQITNDAVGRGPEAVLVLAMQICETHGIHVEVEPLRNVPASHILSKASDGLRSAYASPAAVSQEWSTRTRQRSQPQSQSASEPQQDVVSVVSPIEMQNEAPFGWREQQTSLLKDTIRVAEMIGDHLGMAFFAVILLRDFHASINAEEQRDLIHGIRRTIQAARWQGAHTLQVKYWGPAEPLSNLEIVPLSAQRLPFQKPYKELQTETRTAMAAEQGLAGLNNPFFWNPSGAGASAASKNRTMGLQDESLEVLATLHNPFSVELEIESIKLVTEGVAFEPDSLHIVLPPQCLQTIRLSGTARATGQLRVKGVAITLSGCAEETFLLPIVDKDSEKARQTAAAEADDRRTRIKVVGLDARSSVLKQRQIQKPDNAPPAKKAQIQRASEPAKKAEAKYLQTQIVSRQPLISASCPEIGVSRQLELYEGEMQLMHLDLRNMSENLAVNFLRVRFGDDLSESMIQSASTGELLPGDIHKVYADLLHNPTLSEQTKADRCSIETGASINVPILVRGKKGCTSANITVEYGHVDDKVRQTGSVFYVRQVQLTFAVLVRPVVVCNSLQITALGAAEAAKLTARSLSSSQANAVNKLSGLTLDARDGDGDTEAGLIAATVNNETTPTDDSTFCLVSLDVTSVHPVDDVKVRFSMNTGGVRPLLVNRVIRPGSTARVELPLPRISLSAEHAGKEITSLSSLLDQPQRQFIASKTQLNVTEETAMRRRFWYQQELLQRWNGSWSLVAHGDEGPTASLDEETRFGEVSMQFVSLEDRQVDVLARDPLKVDLDFVPTGLRRSLIIFAEEFAQANVTVTNQSHRPLRLHVRLVPVAPIPPLSPHTLPEQPQKQRLSSSKVVAQEDPSQAHVLIADGTSTLTASPCFLQPGEAISLSTQVLFLATGVFAFTVCIDEIAPTRSEAGSRISFTSCVTHVHVRTPV